MKINPATAKEHAMREKLKQLVERGIAGEVAAAQHKLERLEGRFDFEAKLAEDIPDLFSGRVSPTSGKARALTLKGLNSEIACYIKWAIHAAYGIETSLRNEKNGGVTVLVEASKGSLPILNHVGTQIQRNFETLWSQFVGLPGASERDAKTFLLGLYDGMMNDPRQAGAALPPQVQKKPAGRRKGKTKPGAAPAPQGISIHPYEVALDLGKKIRLSVPLTEIAEELADKEAQARLAGG